MSTNGIDVSSIQSDRYDVSGLDFVFIKVTEGHSYTNPKWVAQRQTARNAGLVTGFYHFARPGPFEVQADYFLSQIHLVDGDILALDWEDPGISGAWKDAWIKRVQQKAPGHKVILYCDRDFWLHRDTTSFAGDGLWIAEYNGRPGKPDIEHPWVFHQYSAQPVDKDLGNFKDKAALVAWC
ncbi:glycoside hydrolase family 25 protein [Streptomyces sp. NPDC055966]|uniref:glycoside hydrolase family 25 protein n=1 Tax=unclassified Streptomyces TaxID=2593676 RepID=UPI0035E0BE38